MSTQTKSKALSDSSIIVILNHFKTTFDLLDHRQSLVPHTSLDRRKDTHPVKFPLSLKDNFWCSWTILSHETCIK